MQVLARRYSKHPLIRGLAVRIIRARQARERDYRAESEAIFRFMRRKIRFTKDIADIETVQTPVLTLKLGAGDCDDISTLLASFLLSVGHRPAFKIVDVGTGGYSHVYVIDFIHGVPIAMDASDARIGFGQEIQGVTRSRMVRV